MNTKKILALLLVAVMAFGLVACGGETNSKEESNALEATNNTLETTNNTSSDETTKTITVEHALGTTEVTYCPERVCVLDSNAMDFIHALGLSEYVASVQSPKGIPAYLEEYYNSDTIIKLERAESGEKSGEAETADPYESYYSIDADLIIGSADTVDGELYAVLSEIAPTVVTDFAIDHEDGMYAGVVANARMIASIWGVEEKLDTMLAEYDALYQQLSEAMNGISCVMMNSTLDSNRIQVVSNDDYESDKEKLECERSGRIIYDLGMNMYSNDAPEEIVEASTYNRNTDEATQIAKNQVIADWINEINPDYVLIVDRNFNSVEEAEAEGYTYAELKELNIYKEGKVYMLSYDGRIGGSGLYGMFIQLDELKDIFLK